MAPHVACEHIAKREQMGAAMVVDYPLWISSCAGCVVQRNRVPFIGRRRIGVIGVAVSHEIFVVDLSKSVAWTLINRIVIVDDQRLRRSGERQRRLYQRGKLPVHDKYPGFGVIKLESQGASVETRVQRIEHGASHRHAIMTLQHGWRVGEHD